MHLSDLKIYLFTEKYAKCVLRSEELKKFNKTYCN